MNTSELMPRIIFRDINADLCAAVAAAFPQWDVACADIWDSPPAHMVVSPANTIGRMDGGIDLILIDRFSAQVEQRLMRDIQVMHKGKLNIGAAHVLPTYDFSLPMLICAPTMEWPPHNIEGTMNAHMAFQAVIMAALTLGRQALNGHIPTVLMSGMGTGTGGLSPADFVGQAKAAWGSVHLMLAANLAQATAAVPQGQAEHLHADGSMHVDQEGVKHATEPAKGKNPEARNKAAIKALTAKNASVAHASVAHASASSDKRVVTKEEKQSWKAEPAAKGKKAIAGKKPAAKVPAKAKRR